MMRADAGLSEFGQHCHAADFYFGRAMIEHPAASDGGAVEKRERVKCVRVVGVHFDFFGDVLLFDEDAAANRPRALHVRGRFDCNHFDARGFVHDRVTSARWTQRQFHFERKRGAVLRSRQSRRTRCRQLSETVLAPELDGGQWIQRGPVSLKALRDKAVVLIDFWDYTCVNCIRTLPYVGGVESTLRSRAAWWSSACMRRNFPSRARDRTWRKRRRDSASNIQSCSTTTTRSGARTRTGSGRRSTWSMRRGAFATTISAKARTGKPK